MKYSKSDIKQILTTASITFLSLFGLDAISSSPSSPTTQYKTPDIASSPHPNSPTTLQHFQVDTLKTYTSTVAYFSPAFNSITVNYFEDRDSIHSYYSLRTSLAHELKHSLNHQKRIKEHSLSLEEHYKICCIDEISAHISTIITLRQDILNSTSDEETQAIIKNNPQYQYYFDEITNSSSSQGLLFFPPRTPKDFENEMRFIAEQTQQYWVKNQQDTYDKNHINMIKEILEQNNLEDIKSNPTTYELIKKEALTIGGYDFSIYLKELNINPSLKQADLLIEKKQSRNAIHNVLTPINEENLSLKEQINNFATKIKSSAIRTLKSLTNNNSAKEYSYIPYHDIPLYPSWSETKRVSPLQAMELHNPDYPFLNKEYSKLKYKYYQKLSAIRRNKNSFSKNNSTTLQEKKRQITKNKKIKSFPISSSGRN